MQINNKPILIIAGEPYSVFTEIFFKSLKKMKIKKSIILIGSKKLFEKQMKKMGYIFNFNEIQKDFQKTIVYKKNTINIINVDFNFSKVFDKISDKSNKYIEQCFNIANNLLRQKKACGLINGPISKKNFLKTKFLGITEYLANKNNVKNFCMLIYNKNFSVSPLTTHIAVKKISNRISKKKLIENVILIKKFYKTCFNDNAKLAITGLNPHCESNYETSEEKKIIIPTIKKLKKKFTKIYGPFPADSLFMKQNIKKFDVVVGMYHDQVLTPIKSIHNFDAINITLGLPYLRISPDHGTNNQMLGKNKSNPASLVAAIKFFDNK